LSAQLAAPIDLEALYSSIQLHNPAPHAGYLRVPEFDVDIASASPELFLARNGNRLTSSPIKGTAKTAPELLDKDSSENIMIVDLVRNDLSHACIKGTVRVDHLLRLEEHPGLVHLVSDVVGEIDDTTSWSSILETTSPPGSVSGAPKSSALETIQRLEKAERNIYCGAFGWVDADKKTADLAVGIRTFWQTTSSGGAQLHFGTGAGITWESDPHLEWLETELKAQRLLNIAAGNIR
jgi:para-aminobenzoate synthetase component 1